MDIASQIIEKIQYVDDTVDIDPSNLTPIQGFYEGAKIFVTGFTGFLGQVLVEKLLKSCPVSTIYVLVRPKKGKDVDARLQEILDDHLFVRVRKIYPDFKRKVVAMEGDCAEPGLGLNDQDRKILIDEVSIVFHVAATVRFNENLEGATAINVRGTRDLLLLAKQMPRLKSFLHVSTAYSNCLESVIEERIYKPPMDYKYIIQICERIDSLLLNNSTKKYLMGDYPNTYVFTKQIAEDTVKQLAQDFPVGIYRPSLVISTYKEPVRGWINNFYGPTGLFYGTAVGLLRVFCYDKESTANLVPVDMCVNGLIASAWDVARKSAKVKETDEKHNIPVYNYESINDKPVNWRTFMDLSSKYSVPFPSHLCIWVFQMYAVNSRFKYLIMQFLLHYIPAAIIDVICFFRGEKMRMLQAYKKIHVFLNFVIYFTENSFQFKSSNIRNMLNHMEDKDLELFFCDLKKLDWDDFFQTFGLGARIYLAKDPINTIPEGRKFYKKLYWADKSLKAFLIVLGITILWLLVSFIYKLIFIA